ncbi:flavin reductase family protein [Oceanobacter mangrovi]|uniref:flavin reductase family protein n=1 Tax=Oceanobacter mangrovi TaxID=2862510 RepID=UPI001C8ED545|nr:flavin reductase family protein [Oceanobacter mangrovi]
MIFEFDDCNPAQRYFLMTQAVIPRPIAWILTDNEDGSSNLAPFSFFTPVCSNPPTLLVSIGKKPSGEDKDTWVNLQRTGKAVVHIATASQIDSLNESSASLALGDSEVERLGLRLQPFGEQQRLVDTPVAFACHFQQQLELGEQHLTLLQVESMYVAEEVMMQVGERQQIDPELLAPLARLGGAEYSLLGELLTRKRPG